MPKPSTLKLKAVFPNTIDLEKKLHPLSLLNTHVSCFAPSTRKTEGERNLKGSKVVHFPKLFRVERFRKRSPNGHQ
jgi:hypothetical protein